MADAIERFANTRVLWSFMCCEIALKDTIGPMWFFFTPQRKAFPKVFVAVAFG